MVTKEGWDSHSIFGQHQPEDPDKWIFHYTTIERATSIALLRAVILSPLIRVNDPRESKWRQIMPMTTGTLHLSPRSVSSEERHDIEDRLESRRLNVRLGCFTRDSDGDGADFGSAKRADARGFARAAMWSHYADRHRGVCLVFDRAALAQQANERFGDRVQMLDIEYVSGFDHSLSRAAIVDFDRLDINAAFLASLATLARKNADWRAEREYRIMVVDEPTPTCILPIHNSLKGLVLGVDFSESNLPLAEAISARFGIAESVAHIAISYAILHAVPARAPDGSLVKWSDDDIRFDRVFEA